MQTQVGDKFIYTNEDVAFTYYIVKQNNRGDVWLERTTTFEEPLNGLPDWTNETKERIMRGTVDGQWHFVHMNPLIQVPQGV